MNLIKKTKKKTKKKNRIFPLIKMILCHFPHALYQFLLYLQKGIIFMASITLIPNNQSFSC